MQSPKINLQLVTEHNTAHRRNQNSLRWTGANTIDVKKLNHPGIGSSILFNQYRTILRMLFLSEFQDLYSILMTCLYAAKYLIPTDVMDAQKLILWLRHVGSVPVPVRVAQWQRMLHTSTWPCFKLGLQAYIKETN